MSSKECAQLSPGPVEGRAGSEWPSYFNCRLPVVTRVTDISTDHSCSSITDPDKAPGSNPGPMSPWPRVPSKLPTSSCSSLPLLPLVSFLPLHTDHSTFSLPFRHHTSAHRNGTPCPVPQSTGQACERLQPTKALRSEAGLWVPL